MASSVPRFLDLSPELRLLIYHELLCPLPGQSLTLYTASDGPSGPLNIHPQILCTNKQIYHEAVHLLYSNTYTIDLTSRFKGSSYRGGELFLPPWNLGSLGSTRDTALTADAKLPSMKYKIHPHIFRRLKHITVVCDSRRLFNWVMYAEYGGNNGDILNKVLRCLQEDPPRVMGNELATTPMTMVYTVDGRETRLGIPMATRASCEDEGEMLTLLGAGSEMTYATVESKLRTHDSLIQESGSIHLNGREDLLLGCSTIFKRMPLVLKYVQERA